MNRTRLIPALLLLGLAGCEQETQVLPFDVDAVVTKTIPASGGSVSTSAGASVMFPASSLPASTQVSVTTTEVPSATRQVGAPASSAFQVDPTGTVLDNPATAELKFTPATDASRAWLATIVTEVNGVATPNPNSRVDLSTRVATGKVKQLGTYTAVIPPASAIFSVQGTPSASLAPSPQDLAPSFETVSVNCGGTASPCTGISVTVSDNVLDLVDEAALIFPKISGSLQANGGPVTGSLTAETSLRVLLKNGTTAESIALIAKLEPTAGSQLIRTATGYEITNVRHTITGSSGELGEGSESEVRTLVISGSSVVVDRTFQIRVSGGALENARLAVNFPVVIQ